MNDNELSRYIGGRKLLAKQVKECHWFAGCHAGVVALRAHPVLGQVPVCDKHAKWENPGYEGLTEV